MMTRSFVVAFALLARDADAGCARTELSPTVLTPDGATLPSDGGVLVGWQVSVYDSKKPQHALGPTFRGKDGNTSVDLQPRQIAPGVYVYRPASTGKGALSLFDGKDKVGTWPRGGVTDKLSLAAPDASSATLTVDTNPRYQKQTFSVDVAGVPDAAVGVLTYDDKGTALAFATVPHDRVGATTIVPYASPGRCAFDPDGMHPPTAGSKVTIAWVDPFGRIGPPSKVLVVK